MLLMEMAVRACNGREGQDMVGMVARMEGWGEDGVPALRLFDTVTNA